MPSPRTPLIVTAACLSLASSQAFAAITPLDSSAFPNKFEGDNATGAPIASPAGTFTTAPSSDGNVMNYVTAGPDGYFNAAGAFVAGTNNASGWTVEVRVRIDPDAPEGSLGAFIFKAGEAGGSGSVGVFIGKNQTRTNLFAALSTASNTDDFHVFRLLQDAGSNDFHVYRDGVLIHTQNTPDFGGDVDFYFGDGTGSGTIDGRPYIDYVRWTAGGFSPVVPEPASVGLLGAGAAMLLARRRATR